MYFILYDLTDYVNRRLMIVSHVASFIQFTIHKKILAGETLSNLANLELFAKIFLTNINFTDTWKTYMAYALTVAYSPYFSSPIAFACMVHQNFPPPNISRVR